MALAQIRFAADIEKMYCQILIHPSDRHLQYLLWRENANEKMVEYQLNTVTYGFTPFLAIRTLHQLAKDEEDHFPRSPVALRRDTCVDDILSVVDNLERTGVTAVTRKSLQDGRFPLKYGHQVRKKLLDDVLVEDLSNLGVRT